MAQSDQVLNSAEFAHVLMLDIVGYSRLSAEEQARAVRRMTDLVHAAPEFRRAEADGDIVPLPTGDGMVLVFFRYPLAPVRCATEIARLQETEGDDLEGDASPSEFSIRQSHDPLPLRMGIHSGPVSRHTDISGRLNFTGSGINMAQRVMDCGEAGSILLSSAAAEVVGQFDEWRHQLVDLGEKSIKHGDTVRITGLRLSTGGQPGPAVLSHALVSSQRRKVSILYKRNAPHSGYLLETLYAGLHAGGFDVFIDRHLHVGIKWARELKQQICSSYAIVPLLSKESIWSEMLEDEVLTAHEAASRQGGLPRILPVRVAYDGPLPEPLSNALGSLQYILWNKPEDDAALVTALVASLRSEKRQTVPIEPVGGAVPLDSRFYIVRPTDGAFSAAVERRDSTILVKGARQIGKTSVLTRALQQARSSGARCIRTDFQKFSVAELSNQESFFRSLAYMVADQLDLDVEPHWRVGRSGAANFERFLKREVLAQMDAPVVWALDEVDRLFSCDFSTDVFALFRSWHNDRAYDPDGPLSRLTLAIAYATEAHLFITDLNQSPFNIGTRIQLSDFTLMEVEELNRRYGCPLHEGSETARLHLLTNGQPHLTRRALDFLVEYGAPLTDVEKMADRDEGIFGDHLRRLIVALSQDSETLRKVRLFLHDSTPLDPASFYRLRSGGLLAGDSPEFARLRCDLYRQYLSRHL